MIGGMKRRDRSFCSTLTETGLTSAIAATLSSLGSVGEQPWQIGWQERSPRHTPRAINRWPCHDQATI